MLAVYRCKRFHGFQLHHDLPFDYLIGAEALIKLNVIVNDGYRHLSLYGKDLDSRDADYRTAFLMHDVEGLSNPEIAESLHLSLPAVKSRVHRSRLFLRERLSRYMEAA